VPKITTGVTRSYPENVEAIILPVPELQADTHTNTRTGSVEDQCKMQKRNAIERKTGAARPQTARSERNYRHVTELICSQVRVALGHPGDGFK